VSEIICKEIVAKAVQPFFITRRDYALSESMPGQAAAFSARNPYRIE
jgi:hypothetical protein